MTKIVIVDDHPSTREGLATRIELEPDLAICGEADDVEDALEVIADVVPDLVIVDVSLRTGNGIDLIKAIHQRFPRVKTIVWSMYDESLYAERALRAGALGYINKRNATDAIVEAIRTVLKGDLYLSKDLSAKMLHRVIHGKESIACSPVEALSDRELETFRLIGQGLTTKSIAKTMKLSPKTVETYRSRIKEKLEIDDMAALIREATQWVLENC